MTETPKTEPQRTPAAAKARAEREARQAEALRANLRRRKAQARGRDQETGETAAHSVYPIISDKI